MFARQEVVPPRRYREVRTVEITDGGTHALGKKYLLERTSQKEEIFHARNDAAAITLAKEKLGLQQSASESLFEKAGGKYVKRHVDRTIIYPRQRH